MFVSYARPDLGLAEQLATALTARGLDVWWDRHLIAGVDFRSALEEEIERADAVVVVWTSNSVRSRWVCEEAALAVEREKLYPVAIGATRPPLGYRTFHTIKIHSATAEQWDQVAEEIAVAVNRRAINATVHPTKQTAFRAIALPDRSRAVSVRTIYLLTILAAVIHWLGTNSWLIAKFSPLSGAETILLNAGTFFLHAVAWIAFVRILRCLARMLRFVWARLLKPS